MILESAGGSFSARLRNLRQQVLSGTRAGKKFAGDSTTVGVLMIFPLTKKRRKTRLNSSVFFHEEQEPYFVGLS
jgi:hypothetical protein